MLIGGMTSQPGSWPRAFATRDVTRIGRQVNAIQVSWRRRWHSQAGGGAAAETPLAKMAGRKKARSRTHEDSAESFAADVGGTAGQTRAVFAFCR